MGSPTLLAHICCEKVLSKVQERPRVSLSLATPTLDLDGKEDEDMWMGPACEEVASWGLLVRKWHAPAVLAFGTPAFLSHKRTLGLEDLPAPKDGESHVVLGPHFQSWKPGCSTHTPIPLEY